MNYEFKHLAFLMNRVIRGDRLTNEDFIFLNDLRGSLKVADEQLETIDSLIEEKITNA